MTQEHAVGLVRDASGACAPLWCVTTASGVLLKSHKVVLALGSFLNTSGLLPGATDLSVDIDLWAKASFHAEISDQDALRLLDSGMPVVTVMAPAGFHGQEGVVRYAGPKSADYVYFFPPVRYDNGRWYIKIGHSPFDPLVTTLEGPSLEAKLRSWMRAEGGDAKGILARSEEFFRQTLQQILPGMRLLGGFVTPCVTSRTPTGYVFLGALRLPPSADHLCGMGLFTCAGCNGSGAKYAVEWGRQLAEAVLREPVLGGKPGASRM